MSRILVIGLSFFFTTVSAAPIQPGSLSQTWWRSCELLDMTHTLSNDTYTLPVADFAKYKFQHTSLVKGMVPSVTKDIYLHYGKFCAIEHVGTHLDAPNHLVRTLENGRELYTMEKVPLTDVIGEACVIDVPEQYKYVRSNYQLTIKDVQNWEEKNGRLHEDCIVIIRSGQERFWESRNDYLGSDTPAHVDPRHGWPDTLSWPGLGPEAAEWILKNRGLKAIGSDSMTFDIGRIDFYNSVHVVVLGANKPGFENLALVSKLPPRGATLIGLPMKHKGGSGGPVRVMAYGWNGPTDPCRMTAGATAFISHLLLLISMVTIATLF